MMHEKWTCVIVSLCFTITSWASDVELIMLEPIGWILQNGEMFNWEENLASIIKRNCREFQEQGWEIRFPSLLIWSFVSQFSPFGEVAFITKRKPSMENYHILTPREMGSS
jgi:hypothetical protein